MQETINFLSTEELNTALPYLLNSPKDNGTLDMIVRRPDEDLREELESGFLTIEEGLEGDSWNRRSSRRTEDGGPHPDMQLNIMNSRVINAIAQSRDRWKLAGDQLFMDLDLSHQNLPAGTRLSIGEAVIEITDQPHLGCKKFVARFGLPAMQFVNSPSGRQLKLRGINAKVIKPGKILVGDVVKKL